jgi:hypothetical protein
MLQKRTKASPEELEIARIINLPMEGMLDEVDTEVFCFENLLAAAFDAGERLRDVQASAVKGYQDQGGGLFPIAVGHGKTGISLMVANSAFTLGLKRVLLIIPPAQVAGLMKRHIPEWRGRVPMDVPFHFLSGRPPLQRAAMVNSGMPGCYVMSYSLVSAKDGLENIFTIQPDLIIADEVHLLKNKTSARTRRVMEYLKDHKPQFVGMSGTITSKSIKDYHHLMLAALGLGAPVPHLARTMHHVDDAINCGAEDRTRANDYGIRLMKPFLSWAKANFPDEEFERGETESYRRAFRHRMHTTPGVVATGDAEFGVSLGITNHEIPKDILAKEPGFENVMKLLADVDDPMVTPNGDDIDHGFHKYKWKRELCSGFYHLLSWPGAEEYAKRKGITEEAAQDILDRAEDHLALRQDYACALRQFFKPPCPKHLDTPMLVGSEMSRNGSENVCDEVYEAWVAMKEADFEGRPDRDKEMVRVSPFKVNAAVRWAKQFKTGIIWTWHPEFGQWVVEALLEAGIDAVWCPAGNDHIEDLGDPLRGGTGDCIAVASIAGHGTGRNLQAFERCLLLEFPREPIQAEQTIGRIHRPGQEADHVDVYTLLTLEFDHHNRAACLNDAIYIQQSTGQHQKIVYADYDPLPQIFTKEFLREQGIDGVKTLTKEQRAMLRMFET